MNSLMLNWLEHGFEQIVSFTFLPSFEFVFVVVWHILDNETSQLLSIEVKMNGSVFSMGTYGFWSLWLYFFEKNATFF